MQSGPIILSLAPGYHCAVRTPKNWSCYSRTDVIAVTNGRVLQRLLGPPEPDTIDVQPVHRCVWAGLRLQAILNQGKVSMKDRDDWPFTMAGCLIPASWLH
jgi:hypothetical protein